MSIYTVEGAVNGTDLSKGLAAYMATSVDNKNDDDMSISSSDTSSKRGQMTPGDCLKPFLFIHNHISRDMSLGSRFGRVFFYTYTDIINDRAIGSLGRLYFSTFFLYSLR